MKTPQQTSARRIRVILALTAAGTAATAAMAWGWTYAVQTVGIVSARTPAGQAPSLVRPGQASTAGRAPTAAPVPSATKGTGNGNGSGTPRLGPITAAPAGPKGSGGAGDSPEVSLAEAGRAEVGQAAASRKNGKDHSAHLKKRGAIDPGQVLSDGNLSLGGCLPQYGAAGQCLPAVPPSLSRHLRDMKDAGLDPASMPHPWSCGEVREYFKKGLPVRQPNVDPQKLDANKDGVACGPAD
jgi:hypothetical protein